MLTESPSWETMLGPDLRSATFQAPRPSLLFGECLLSTCVPGPVLGTGRIYKRWLQPLTPLAIS